MKSLTTMSSIFAFALFSQFLFATDAPPLSTVSSVDLDRYLGEWHEIARLPMKHQDGCITSKAEYSKDKKGGLVIKNSCTTADGGTKTSEGIGRVKDTTTNAKLEVNFAPSLIRFFGWAWGNYWIIELEPSYQYAVVSEPKREYLWILSRKPEMDKTVYDGIIERLKANSFKLDSLIVSGTITTPAAL